MKRILDSVHGYIEIPKEYCKAIVDTEYFQRLRRVEQTSTRSIFPSARHDRFIHSLGVFHLGTKFIKTLRRQFDKEGVQKPDNLDMVFESYLLACLLHDVAHSPFSHTFEDYYTSKYSDTAGVLCQLVGNEVFEKDWEKFPDRSASHERMSAIVALGVFGEFIDSRGADRELVARMIIGLYYNIDRPDHSFENAMIDLIHGDVIDADGLDYVCRDAWASGYSTTRVDVDRLTESVCIVPDKTGVYHLCFTEKCLNEIDSVLTVKNFQQYYVINHHTVTYEQALLVKAMESAAVYHIYGKTNVDDSEMREDALKRLCDLKSFYNIEGASGIKTPHTGVDIYLPMDDDFIALMKPVRNDVYVNQWLSRQYKLQALWKSKAEFYQTFNRLKDIPLKKGNWLFRDECREHISYVFGIPMEMIWTRKATPKYKGNFADKVEIIVNGDIIPYSKLFPKDVNSYEPQKSEFYYIYVPREANREAILEMLQKEYTKFFINQD